MKLLEWKEAFLSRQSASIKVPDEVRRLFGKPFILNRSFQDIHIAVIEGEPLVTAKLLREGSLVFGWHGYDYGCCAEGEKLFAVPPLLYAQGIRLSEVKRFKGKVDWEAEVPELELVD